MNMVDNIARRNSEQAVKEGLRKMAVLYTCTADWIAVAAPIFTRALVGDRDKPFFTDSEITAAFEATMSAHEYNSIPRPGVVVKMAESMAPPRPMQKLHNDPLPTRRWTDAERAANIAKIDAMQAFLTAQEPEFRRALNEHGYGTPGLLAVQEKHRRELQEFIDARA